MMQNKLLVIDRRDRGLHVNRILQRYGLDPAQWKVVTPGESIMGFRAEMILIDVQEMPVRREEREAWKDWFRTSLRCRMVPGTTVFITADTPQYFAQYEATPDEED